MHFKIVLSFTTEFPALKMMQITFTVRLQAHHTIIPLHCSLRGNRLRCIFIFLRFIYLLIYFGVLHE